MNEILDAKDGLHLGIKTKNVLVIGGAGYIGSALSRQLLDAGYRVRVLDSVLFGDSSISDLVGHPDFELLRADFRSVESLVNAIEGIDAVIHLAAIVGDPACTIKNDLTTEINYAATRMLIKVCKGAAVRRLLFASTCSVYGASEFLMDECSAPNPISLYAQTKLDSEQAILESKSPTLHPTCLRLATVFGLSPRPRFDLVVNLLVARAAQDGKIQIFNHEQWRPFIHVTDVARAFVHALQAPISLVSGEIFNVGSYDLNYSLGQVAEKIRERIPQVEIEYKENPDRRNYRVSFDKIHSCLGFVCKTGLEEGIKEIKEAIETRQIQNYRDKVFSNYEYLLGARDELLKSEPGIQLFNVLEPDDAAVPTLAAKTQTAGAAS
jgi:nucleoside-diphosphate-sugar epimerase